MLRDFCFLILGIIRFITCLGIFKNNKNKFSYFLKNQERASGLRDASILPDLCTSHKQQLLVMMRNHQHIVSIRKRCVKAKEELSLNLYTRSVTFYANLSYVYFKV